MQMKKSSVEELRKKHPRFIYENFAWELSGNVFKVKFRFKTEPDLVFEPHIEIESVGRSFIDGVPRRIVDILCFHLGLVEIMSYWKATCSPEISIRAGFLNGEQVEWWRDLILHGMGEYFFVNNIDFTSPNIVSISVDSSQAESRERHELPPLKTRSLILTSGGKDTALTLSIFSSESLEFDCLILNPVQAALDLSVAAGKTQPLIVRREIATNLLELNKRNYLNGHTPFSAYLAFLGLTCSVLFGYKFVVVSNERSSDEGNLNFLDSEINHQYSKTLRFEKRFQYYVTKYLTPDVHYFSFLRPLYDIQIMGLLAQYPKALSTFKSCNRNQKQNTWCGHCPKCLSVYTMLYPFVGREGVVGVFKHDPFEDESNITLIQELAGIKGHKPFECVGTRRETIAGLFLGLQRAKHQGSLPAVWRYVESDVLPHYSNFREMVHDVLLSWGDAHTLPREFETILKRHFGALANETLSYETC